MAEFGMIAACGLDCGSCSIRRYPFDERAAAEAIPWYRKMGWLQDGEGVAEAIERKLACNGCHGDRTAHWSADCWILQCCVDSKRLRHCSECPGFPCERLVAWSNSDDSYGRAFARLSEMHSRVSG
jgi:hypothetical protein